MSKSETPVTDAAYFSDGEPSETFLRKLADTSRTIEKDRDELRATVTRLESEVTALKQDKERLQDICDVYADHTMECACRIETERPCDCGFAAAVTCTASTAATTEKPL